MIKLQKIGEPYSVLNNPDSIHNYFAWPSIIRLTNGKIAVASSGFRIKHVDPFGKAVIAFSEDEGKTFTRPVPVIDTVLDDRDAGLCTFGEQGLIITSFNNTVNMQRGHHPDRNGIGAYINAYLDCISPEKENAALGSTFRVSFDNGITWGKIYHSPITSPHGPLRMKNGEILWVGKTFFTERDDSTLPKTIKAMTLNPTTGEMQLRGEIPPVYIAGEKADDEEPYTFELPSGELICHIRVEHKGRYFTIFQSRSKDSGSTWSEPVPILPETGGAPAHVLVHSSGILIGTVGYRNPPYGIHTYFSNDGANTWEEGEPLFEKSETWDVGYPMTCELKDGTLLTAFYSHPGKAARSEIFLQHWKTL